MYDNSMEHWKIIKNYENYAISDCGNVKNVKTGRILHVYSKKGYYLTYLYNKNGRKIFLVHRLVAMAFIPNPHNDPQINHKDENGFNNIVSNLEWCSAKYNANYGNHNKKRMQTMLIKGNAWLGRKHTDESKLKMSLAKKGKPSSNRKPITVNGVTYESMAQAREKLHIGQRKIYKILGGK